MPATSTRSKLAALSAVEKRRLRKRMARLRGTSTAEIARSLGVSTATLRRFCIAQGWPARHGLHATARQREFAGRAPPARAKTWSLAEAAAALRRQASGQIAALNAALDGDGADPDKAARALASLARTLKTAQSLEHAGGAAADAADDEPARSLADLRDELAARLARVAADEDARAVPREPDRDGAAAAR